jgi:predicted DNA-binding protein (UPF0251 family)
LNNFKEAQAKPEQQPQQSFDIALQQKEFLSIDEAAKLIGASRRTIHRLISGNKLQVGKVAAVPSSNEKQLIISLIHKPYESNTQTTHQRR